MYLVAFELRHDYSAEAWHRASNAMRTLFDSSAPLYSTWLVESELSAGEIVEALLGAGAIHERDGIVVLELSGKASARNVAAMESMQWLESRFALS